VQTLEDYFDSLTLNFQRQFKAAIDTDHRFVVSVDENSGYFDQQIQEIFTDIDGIKEAKDLHDWILR